MTDVFITFAPADAELALRIQKSLERSGISATRGPVQFSPAWPTRLLDELDQCTAVIALWSRAALATDWVPTEAAIGAHFGQTVSIRTDPSMDRNLIPAIFQDAPGAEIADIYEGDLAPNGWSQSAAEMLDRKLAPVFGRIRALKARGPVAVPAAAAGAVIPAEEAQRRVSGGFTWVRHAGDRSGRSMPALAATRREAAFRSAYNALAAMDYPSDIRVGLVDFGDPVTTRRGLSRIYAEALSRNDREFWGLLGRLAAPLCASISLAGLQRGGDSQAVVADLTDPRDARDLHDERFGRARSRGGGGVVLWPIMAVAVGLLALVAAPQIQRFAPNLEFASFELPKLPTFKSRPKAAVEIAPPPWVNGENTVRAAPLPTTPAPIPVSQPAAPSDPFFAQAMTTMKLRYCRLQPEASEIVVEVMEGERLLDVAGRVFMESTEGIAQIAERNAACLQPRTLMLEDGRQIAGSDLLFQGDRLVIPVQKTNSAGAVPSSTAL